MCIRDRFDPDPNELGRELDIESGVSGDLAKSLEGLLPRTQAVDREWTQRVRTIRSDVVNARPPPELVSHVRDQVEDDAIFVVDVTSIAYRAFDEFPVYQPRTFLYPCYYVTLGYAVAAAIGAKVARPDRMVWAVDGDGCFQMTGQELVTATVENIPIKVALLNNSYLGMVRQ